MKNKTQTNKKGKKNMNTTQVSNLDELFDLMQANAKQLGDWTDLPVFSDKEVKNPYHIWSWDDTRLIYGTCADDIQIIARTDVSERFTLHYYDVWGTSEDGWTINEVFDSEKEIKLYKDCDDMAIIDTLRHEAVLDHGEFTVNTSNEDIIYISHADDGEPVCELRRVEG
jgi:hypothetical protein